MAAGILLFMRTHEATVKFIWDIAELLRGPYRPPQYERVVLPMTVLRRFDCVLEDTKAEVLAEYERVFAQRESAELPYLRQLTAAGSGTPRLGFEARLVTILAGIAKQRGERWSRIERLLADPPS